SLSASASGARAEGSGRSSRTSRGRRCSRGSDRVGSDIVYPPPRGGRTRLPGAMRRSTERFLTTHVGSLVRPTEIADAIRAGGAPNVDARVSRAVRDVVRKQAEIGIDVVSDGEYSKPNFASYVNERLSGF